MLLKAYKDYLSLDQAFYKDCFIKVIGIFILDTIFLLNRLYKQELKAYSI